jgi:hypothetical protein
MNVSPEEARASLAAVQQTRGQMRKQAGASAYFAVIWGLVWFFGCLATQFLLPRSIWLVWLVWLPLLIVGSVLSGILGYHLGTQTRTAIGARHGLFYLALGTFSLLWLFLFQPLNANQVILFFITIVSFGGVVSGILERTRAGMLGSLAFLLVALLGYYLVPAYFFLWIAVFCGLPFAGVGIVVRLRWR